MKNYKATQSDWQIAKDKEREKQAGKVIKAIIFMACLFTIIL